MKARLHVRSENLRSKKYRVSKNNANLHLKMWDKFLRKTRNYSSKLSKNLRNLFGNLRGRAKIRIPKLRAIKGALAFG